MVRIIEADVTKTKIPSTSVDIAFFVNILHDLVEPSMFLKEVRRIIRKDSVIVDIDWKKRENGFGPPLELRLTAVQSRKILQEAGFEVTKPVHAGRFHYGLVCRPV